MDKVLTSSELNNLVLNIQDQGNDAIKSITLETLHQLKLKIPKDILDLHSKSTQTKDPRMKNKAPVTKESDALCTHDHWKIIYDLSKSADELDSSAVSINERCSTSKFKLEEITGVLTKYEEIKDRVIIESVETLSHMYNNSKVIYDMDYSFEEIQEKLELVDIRIVERENQAINKAWEKTVDDLLQPDSQIENRYKFTLISKLCDPHEDWK